MSHRPLGLPAAALAAVVLLVPLTACTDNSRSDAASDGTLAVESTDDACNLSAGEAPSGNLVFEVTNGGSDVTEFYLLGDDGLRIVGEVENVGPGLTRDLVVRAAPGQYFTACKPGMVGDGIRASFTVTDSGEDLDLPDDIQELVETASSQYAAYVRDQSEQLLTATQEFADLYTSGRDDEARAAYAPTHMHWERIEPVAESFGDLDPRLDLWEADLAEGEEWTGWHRIEKDLWPPADSDHTPLTTAERHAMADQLVADTQDLYDRTRDLTYTADQLGNGAKELLDEVATGKVTGEEEIWSHTDLWDFQVNVEGARIAFEDLRPALEVKDPELATTIAQRFDELQVLLDQHRDGDGFVLYTELSDDEVRELSDGVNALSEPLSELTAAVVL
ncbi:MAG: EfeM/EfeO family lipoprotein [Acidimicrobiia bacterium]|nr:EfeM/EfeO family lipoprotein [Acidimicrobiia bacterium]